MVSYIAPTQAVKVSPKTTYNQTPSQVQLSPETKSTLTSGLMASILGATWFAPTKIKGADELMQVSPDIFEITTKKASQMAQNTNERQAYEGLKALRDFVAKQKTTSVNNLFGNKTEMSVKELFNKIDPRIKTVSRADKIAEALAQRAEKFNLFSIFPHPETLTNGITNEHFIALDKLIPDKSSKQLVAFKNAFKQKFPKGTKFTTEELLEFIKPHINQLGQKKRNS